MQEVRLPLLAASARSAYIEGKRSLEEFEADLDFYLLGIQHEGHLPYGKHPPCICEEPEPSTEVFYVEQFSSAIFESISRCSKCYREIPAVE